LKVLRACSLFPNRDGLEMESFGFPNRRLLAWLSSGLFCLSCPQTAQSPLTLFGRELAGPNLQNRGGGGVGPGAVLFSTPAGFWIGYRLFLWSEQAGPG